MPFPKLHQGRLSAIATTALQLTATSRRLRSGLWITADDGNANPLYAGEGNAITADGADTTSGQKINPSDTAFFAIDDPAKMYVIGPSGTTGHKVFWHGS